ncbi:response regulator [Erythrobacter dokdonensis]|uniref:Two-component response regulator n=1 Tax=Erythrobacter dokdonensis DSW-74 TaxID=1300349 RepID=A0A1A7BBR1_9SPHN|nr:response regulator [Erythrobacter dokdonensis]OBV09973.1 Two-component response regulator [Erythrobacter dokdonensis DSW-74]
MSLGNQIATHLPYLRRYARALTGSQEAGDALVRTMLEKVLSDPSGAAALAGGRVPLYRTFSRVWADAQPEDKGASVSGGEHEAGAQLRLGAITPPGRQALLLTTLEDFTLAEAAAILERDVVEVEQLVADAVAGIEREQKTSVLVIEDEPLIAMQLEDLVAGLGHTISATAATRTQAREAVAERMPGLVLADIQLADGSSGLDAVEDILSLGSVPVIFITAYPERLLTGDRPEPTYLVTKPFQEATVRAAISQALFFRSSQPLG